MTSIIKFKLFGVFLVLFSLVSSEHTKNNEVQWEAYFDKIWAEVRLGEPQTVSFEIEYFNATDFDHSNIDIQIISSNLNVAQIDVQFPFKFHNNKWSGDFTVIPKKIGRSLVSVEIDAKGSSTKMETIVVRNPIVSLEGQALFERFLHLFYVFLNITFGIALNLNSVITILRRPSALVISILFTGIILPLVCYISWHFPFQ